ncbi:AfsR/SARP family transcriptional regulator [Amycolatopsis solani]|uniref:AfsR/SARP family transcriptional regulator n=1 Tax=Amycolatopsis solani TaxID=3028615 RepID=UPI00296E5D5B|nr:BTAD domain-containing putative transcriptional regulator [Amycolatopsis sp. MEP2-6]
MDIRVLGSVEVWAGAAPVPVGGSKPRALLAALALVPGHVCSVSRLVDVVWGADSPATATDLVQSYVSTLRRKLPGGGEVIETRPPGYVLRVEPDAVDHLRFERLVAEARAEVARGSTARAAELFDEALSLWRGPALGELGRSTLAAEAARLDEARLSVLEERAAVGLALGGYEALVGELTAAVRQHPAREALRRHLMVALFALDRQADALAVYREGRQFLVDEHGVEPGPVLRAAHDAILRSDAEALGIADRPGPPAPGRASKAGPRPAQLPAVPPDFTGRGRQLAEVTEGLVPADGTVPVWVVSGQGGVGKSTLALRAAHELAAAFADGQLFAQLHGTTSTPASIDAILARFLKALGDAPGDTPSTVEEQAERYRSVLAGRRVLVVLDDAATEAQVRPLLPGTPGCAVLVTSRNRLAGLVGARRIELDVLADAEARELLVRITGDDRAAAEPAALERLVDQSARLPLAVRIIGVRLATRRHWRLAQLSARLDDETRRLDELSAGDQQVRVSFGISYDALGPDARTTLRHLGALGLPTFPVWVIGALLDAPDDVVDRVVDDLLDAHLLTFGGVDACGQSRFEVHDLLRIFAAERAAAEDAPDVVAAAVTRVVTGWLYVVDTVLASRPPGGLTLRAQRAATERDPWPWLVPAVRAALAEPRTWFTTEHHSLVAGVERAAALDLGKLAGDLASALAASFAVSNLFEAWTQTHNSALAAARRSGDRQAEAMLLAEFGQLRYKQDRLAEARTYLMQALQVFRELGDRRGEALTLAALATANHEQGYLSEALHFFELADAVFHELGDDSSLAYSSRLAGLVQLELGELADAQRLVTRALEAFRRLGSRRGEGMTLRTLSLVHRARGEYRRAYELGEQARTIFEETGDQLLEAYSARSVAKALVRLGRAAETDALLARAVRTSRSLGDRWGEAMSLRTTGERDLALGRLADAERRLRAAIRLWRAIDLPLHQARTQRDLADTLEAAGDVAAAAALRAEMAEVFRLYGVREQDER